MGIRPFIFRDVPDTTLSDTGFNRIVIYRIPDSLNIASLNIRVKEWNGYTIVSVVYN